MSHPESKGTTARRTLVKGAAWSVPAIAVATPARAAAVSGPIIVTPQGGQACKFPGNSCSPYFQAYRFVFCFTNQSAQAITVNFSQIVLPQGTNTTPIPTSIVVPAGAVNVCYYIIANNQGNSANGQGTLFFNYTFNGQLITGSVGTGANELPPCPNCSDQFGTAGAALVIEEESSQQSAESSVAETPAEEEETTEVPAQEQDAAGEEESESDQ